MIQARDVSDAVYNGAADGVATCSNPCGNMYAKRESSHPIEKGYHWMLVLIFEMKTIVGRGREPDRVERGQNNFLMFSNKPCGMLRTRFQAPI